MIRDYPAAPELLHSAASLFQEQGYDTTTISELALAGGMTVQELEALYPQKEHLVLALYRALGQASLSEAHDLPKGSIAQRYQYLLQRKVQQLTPHEDALSALFAMAMRRRAPLQAADIAPGKTDPMYQVCAELVAGAEDAPGNAQEAEDAALLLYGVYHYSLLFWLYDRTEGKRATEMMLTMIYEFFKLSRPMLMMPLLGKSVSKMGRVMMLIFGGARLVEPPTNS